MIAAFTMPPRLSLCGRGGPAWAGGGGEEVPESAGGDADGPADADRGELAAGDRLIELVAADPQDPGRLPDVEDVW
jgi:hypothetical protein